MGNRCVYIRRTILAGFVLTVYSAWVLLVEIVRQGPSQASAGSTGRSGP